MNKMISLALTVASVLVFQTSSMLVINAKSSVPINTNDNISYILNPDTNEYLRVRDMTIETESLTLENVRSTDINRPVPINAEISIQNNTYNDNIESPPIPGGVGYGVYYNDSYMQEFTTGTTLAYDIICPTTVGGDVNTYLYLTATNRAYKCCEAYISYYGQREFEFVVFDWAQNDGERWQRFIPYEEMDQYFDYRMIHGVNRRIISVQNSTQQIGTNRWENYVWLLNYELNTYDLIYSYSYTATLSDQYGDYASTWGPIVETFQDSYNVDTNTIGFNNCYMMSKTTPLGNSNWNGWELLTNSNSHIVTNNSGLTRQFLDPNYCFGVH